MVNVKSMEVRDEDLGLSSSPASLPSPSSLVSLHSPPSPSRHSAKRKQPDPDSDCESVASIALDLSRPYKMSSPYLVHEYLFKELSHVRHSILPLSRFGGWDDADMWLQLTAVMHQRTRMDLSVCEILNIASNYHKYYTDDPTLASIDCHSDLKHHVKLVFAPSRDKGPLNLQIIQKMIDHCSHSSKGKNQAVGFSSQVVATCINNEHNLSYNTPTDMTHLASSYSVKAKRLKNDKGNKRIANSAREDNLEVSVELNILYEAGLLSTFQFNSALSLFEDYSEVKVLAWLGMSPEKKVSWIRDTLMGARVDADLDMMFNE